MSGRKRKREKVVCTDEMFKETLMMCEGYIGAMERLKKNQESLENYTRKRENAKSSLEATVFDQEIERLGSQIQSDDEDTSYFRWALAHLDDREQTVLTQLYVDGYTWDSVLSEDDEPMSVGAIDSARKRGIRKMAALISDMKKWMSEPTESSELSESPEPSESSELSESPEMSGSSESSEQKSNP